MSWFLSLLTLRVPGCIMSDNHPLAGGKAPDFASHIRAASKPLVPKRHAITNDYTILTRSLGVGVNGKVLECIHKATGAKRALKVCSPVKYYLHKGIKVLSLAYFNNQFNPPSTI